MESDEVKGPARGTAGTSIRDQRSRNAEAPERERAPDAFLLYNSKQQGVREFVEALRATGFSVWYSVDSLDAGDDWDKRETKALREARCAIVVLGEAGWGSYQQAYTERAVELRKNLLPVVLGRTDADSFGRIDGLFHRLKRIHFESPTDERALAELVGAVRRFVSRVEDEAGGDRLPEEKRRRPIDVARVMARLTSESLDEREEMLDELEIAVSKVDCEPLWRVLAEKVLGESSPGGEEQQQGRASLVEALGITFPNHGVPADLESVVNHFKTSWKDWSTSLQLAYVAGGLRGRPDGYDSAQPDPFWARDPLIRRLLETIGWRGQPDHVALLRAQLTGNWSIDVFQVLRVVAVPELVPDLIDLTIRGFVEEGAIFALAHAELTQAFVTALDDTSKLTDFLGAACIIAGSARPYLLKRVQSLVSWLPPARVRECLSALHAFSDVELRAGALHLRAALSGASTQLMAGFRSDGNSDTPDDLGVAVDVQTLCSVILARDVDPPLSIGLFGDWGTGKSFFMDRMWDRIRSMAIEAERAGEGKRFHTRVAQIRFNAWHYIDANLWASLVSHIIEELARAVAPEDPAAARKALVTELETAKQLKEEAQDEHKRALQERRDAEKSLSEAATQRATKQVSLADLHAKDLWLEIREDQEIKEGLASVEALGLPKVLASADELDAAVREAYSLAGRVRAVLLEFPKNTSRLAVIVVGASLLLLVPAVAYVLQKFLKEQTFTVGVSAAFTEVAGILGAAALFLKKPMQTAKQVLDTLGKTKARAVKLLEQARQERSKEEIELEKALNELRAKEQSAGLRLSEADAKIQRINARLLEIDEGRSLSKYLLERMQSDDYRRHLGIVSTIRRDFEKLATLLNTTAEATNTQPIQRIVLYVDDLDRCPVPRVLEVLQAVHLLLAFKLFVVVVGVDPRWLLHALERTYSAFRPVDRKRGREWLTTPQNYLEKIFQIPFSLKPMDPAGFQRLMQTLLPVRNRGLLTNGHAPPVGVVVDAPSPPEQGAPPHVGVKPVVPPVPSPGTPGEGSGGAHPPVQPQAPARPPVSAPPPPNPASSRAASGVPELDYNALEIRQQEQDFAARLLPLVPSPRSANRFTNVYRLLKARLSKDDLLVFEGTLSAPGDFRAVMFLLALMTRFPNSAASMFAALSAADETEHPSRHFGDGAHAGVADPDQTAFERDTRALLDDLPDTLKPFQDWAPHAARFSFNAARSVTTTRPSP